MDSKAVANDLMELKCEADRRDVATGAERERMLTLGGFGFIDSIHMVTIIHFFVVDSNGAAQKYLPCRPLCYPELSMYTHRVWLQLCGV